MMTDPDGDRLAVIDSDCKRRLEHVTVSTCISTAAGQ
ncbi:hypothetical protein BDK88_3356 [Natrinema hispanicum]|uniref:Uncharacterized protein n=1 Tax=Natrinema hispanicum TaxID=392421 RepID=A0A482Y519_9EURY|nr:hypothetical protein BDK88_3356 [Natrinema hispanicum]